jgi:hypothetical protein
MPVLPVHGLRSPLLRAKIDYLAKASAMKFTQILFSLTLFAFASAANAQLTTRSAAGANAAAITPMRDQFRMDIGGGTVAGANGSFGGLRREINWDGVPAPYAAPNYLPADFFNTTSPRGVVFSTPGTGFQVSGSTGDSGAGQPAAAYFGNIDLSYTTTFQSFSPQRLFTSLGGNVVDVSFYVPGTNIPAAVTGFGAVFTDVDQVSTTSLSFFDRANVSLGVFYAAASSGGLSFLGAFTNDGLPDIGRVRVTLGNTIIGPLDNNGSSDIVVADDFIYGEPTDRIFGDGFE